MDKRWALIAIVSAIVLLGSLSFFIFKKETLVPVVTEAKKDISIKEMTIEEPAEKPIDINNLLPDYFVEHLRQKKLSRDNRFFRITPELSIEFNIPRQDVFLNVSPSTKLFSQHLGNNIALSLPLLGSFVSPLFSSESGVLLSTPKNVYLSESHKGQTLPLQPNTLNRIISFLAESSLPDDDSQKDQPVSASTSTATQFIKIPYLLPRSEYVEWYLSVPYQPSETGFGGELSKNINLTGNVDIPINRDLPFLGNENSYYMSMTGNFLSDFKRDEKGDPILNTTLGFFSQSYNFKIGITIPTYTDTESSSYESRKFSIDMEFVK